MEKGEFRAVFAKISEGKIYAGPCDFDGEHFNVSCNTPLVSVKEVRSGRERKKVLLFDADSLSKKVFNPAFVEKVHVTGSDIWLVETVKNIADIADGFIANIFRLVVPVHTIESFDVLREAVEISEDCVPLIIVSRGKAAGDADLLRLTDDLISLKFANIVVMDLDRSLGEDTWKTLKGRCPGLIRYIPLAEDGIVENVFGFTSSRWSSKRTPKPFFPPLKFP